MIKDPPLHLIWLQYGVSCQFWYRISHEMKLNTLIWKLLGSCQFLLRLMLFVYSFILFIICINTNQINATLFNHNHISTLWWLVKWQLLQLIVKMSIYFVSKTSMQIFKLNKSRVKRTFGI